MRWGWGPRRPTPRSVADRLGFPLENVGFRLWRHVSSPGWPRGAGARQTASIGARSSPAHRDLVGELFRFAGNDRHSRADGVEVGGFEGGLAKLASHDGPSYASILARAGCDEPVVEASRAPTARIEELVDALPRHIFAKWLSTRYLRRSACAACSARLTAGVSLIPRPRAASFAAASLWASVLR